jgi:hypothetical protein
MKKLFQLGLLMYDLHESLSCRYHGDTAQCCIYLQLNLEEVSLVLLLFYLIED